jgi:RNA polymerase sigma-70 factor (ECF subfamily)
MQEDESVNNFLAERSHESFALVMEEYFDLIKKVIFRLVLNHEDAEDLVQITFITAYQKVDQFKGSAKFATWLCRIAHNHAYSFLRKKQMKITPIHEVAEPHSSKLDHPDSDLHRNDMQMQIEEALKSLSPELRATLVLITIDETPIDEAVEILNCNRATLYWRLHRARKLMKEELGKRNLPLNNR